MNRMKDEWLPSNIQVPIGESVYTHKSVTKIKTDGMVKYDISK